MLKRLAIFGAAMLLVTGSAFAGVITVGNARPVTIGSSAETALFGAGGLLTGKADSNQLGYDYFAPAGSNFSEFSLQFEKAGHAPGNQLYIYSLEDYTKSLLIFSGAASPVTNVGVNFKYDAATNLWKLRSIDLDALTVIGTATFSSNAFGFAMKYGSSTYYGDDTLNPNSNPQMLVFDGKNNWANGYWFAFEDVAYASADKDFNDMVFYGQSINPVPEPGTMMLLGSGLVGLAGWGRRKIRK